MMHEPIQAKGPTMSEQLMEQYRLRGQRKCRNACIAAIVTVVLVLAVAGGVLVDGRRWQRIGSQYVQAEGHACHAAGSQQHRNLRLPHRTGIPGDGSRDRGTGNVNYSPASMWMALAIAAQGANGRPARN